MNERDGRLRSRGLWISVRVRGRIYIDSIWFLWGLARLPFGRFLRGEAMAFSAIDDGRGEIERCGLGI